MNLAISNIGWPAELDAVVYPLLAAKGISGLEVAPTRIWPEWEGITPSSMREFRSRVEDAGLQISSLQSILFRKPELRLFGSSAGREALYEHLCVCAELAAALGAECLVFGAPGNRDRGILSEGEAFAIAAEFFARVGAYYSNFGTCLGFEANPAQYGCSFATCSATAARLVRAVGSPGFRLHLDTACLHLAREDAVSTICANRDVLCHFHVSEPYLGAFSAPEIPHRKIAGALTAYEHWVSLEMRAGNPPLPALEEAADFLRRTYAN